MMATALLLVGAIAAVSAVAVISSSSRARDPLTALAILALVLEIDVEPLAGAAIDSARDLLVAASIMLAASYGWWTLRSDRLLALRTPLVYLLAIPVSGLVMAPWSLDPVGSASKSVALIGLMLLVSVAVARRGLFDVLESLTLALAVLLVFSAILIASGISEPSLDWAGEPDTGFGGLFRYGGLAGDPNALGRAAALCAIGGALLVGRGRGRFPVVVEAIGCGGMLLAQSRTALAVGVVVLCVIHLGMGHKRAVVSLIAVGSLAAGLIFLSSGSVVDFVTREGGGVDELTTATGRTVLWEAAWAISWERPITGHGAFASEQALADAVATRWVPFEAPDAHNLLLNLFLTQGLVAVALIVALAGSVVAARPIITLRTPDPRLALLGSFVLLSLLENTMRKPSVAVMVVTAAVASLSLLSDPDEVSPSTKERVLARR